ncbi:Wzz/FepE/Etk N-terminal domain-containing protein [Desulfurivibrio sp. C05AmB]|uniref:Wzz/FepE/Etk N-terminal domain-containing protein n=1 Tax=Desulfurivibrio sp. C05AmB TaxID=3374371 RepID=UPI00376ECE31
MEDKKANAPVIAPGLSPCCYQQPGGYKDSEISLVDLWLVLVRQWRWIAGVTALVVAVAGVYLLLATPIYEAEAVLLPPEDRHVQALNIPGINVITHETAPKEREKIYKEFVSNLRGGSLRRQFFTENNLFAVLGGNRGYSEELVFRRKFHEALQIREENRDQPGFVFVTLRGENSELIAGLVNEYIQLAARSTVDKYVDGIRTKIVNEKETLQEQIRIEREFARQRRLDKVALLDEEISIARELNIIDRDDAPLRTLESSNFGVAVSTTEEPLYLRGVRDLTAEMQALKQRENDDPFIPGLRDKQAKLDLLESGLRMLQTARAELLPARLDQQAVSPEKPAQPQKMLVLALSLVLGGVLGVLVAAFQEFLSKVRSTE